MIFILKQVMLNKKGLNKLNANHYCWKLGVWQFVWINIQNIDNSTVNNTKIAYVHVVYTNVVNKDTLNSIITQIFTYIPWFCSCRLHNSLEKK